MPIHTPRRTVLLGLAATGVTACLAQPPASPGAGQRGIIKIGLGAPFSGGDPTVAQQVLHGVRQALVDQNAAGGIAGYGVQLVAYDDEWDPDVAARRAEEIALDPRVIAVVGHLLVGTADAARAVYDRAKLPFLSFAAGEPRNPTPRLLPTATEFADAVIEQIGRLIGGRRAALVVVTTAGFPDLAEAFAETLDRAGWTLTQRAEVSDRTLQFAPVVGRLAADPPDLVVFVGLPDQGTALAEEIGRELSETRIVGVGTVESPEWRTVVSGSRVLQLGLDWQRTTAEAATLGQKLLGAANQVPQPWMALAYQTTQFLIGAATSDPSRDGVGKAIAGQVQIRPSESWPTEMIVVREG